MNSELTDQEQTLLKSISLDLDRGRRLKQEVRKPLDKLQGVDESGRLFDVDGVSIAVANGREAESVMRQIRSILPATQYAVFWSNRKASNGLTKCDEVDVVRSSDPLAGVRLKSTNGANYDVSNLDVINRLLDWQKMCEFDLVGASDDWVALRFRKLPDRICSFAEEVYLFCPDTVEQGIGLRSEEDDPELFEEAGKLCPDHFPRLRKKANESTHEMFDGQVEIPAALRALMGNFGVSNSKNASDALWAESERGVRLLARELKRTKYVFLWWD